MQIGLVSFTVLGFFLTAIKLPQYGLIANLISQVFWFYASYRAWKEANQFGLVLNTSFIIVILLYGVINYWFL